MHVANSSPHVRDNSLQLVQSLEQRFWQCLLAETYRAGQYSIIKTSKETLQRHAARVTHLISRANPDIEDTPIYNDLSAATL